MASEIILQQMLEKQISQFPVAVGKAFDVLRIELDQLLELPLEDHTSVFYKNARLAVKHQADDWVLLILQNMERYLWVREPVARLDSEQIHNFPTDDVEDILGAELDAYESIPTVFTSLTEQFQERMQMLSAAVDATHENSAVVSTIARLHPGNLMNVIQSSLYNGLIVDRLERTGTLRVIYRFVCIDILEAINEIYEGLDPIIAQISQSVEHSASRVLTPRDEAGSKRLMDHAPAARTHEHDPARQAVEGKKDNPSTRAQLAHADVADENMPELFGVNETPAPKHQPASLHASVSDEATLIERIDIDDEEEWIADTYPPRNRIVNPKPSARKPQQITRQATEQPESVENNPDEGWIVDTPPGMSAAISDDRDQMDAETTPPKASAVDVFDHFGFYQPGMDIREPEAIMPEIFPEAISDPEQEALDANGETPPHDSFLISDSLALDGVEATPVDRLSLRNTEMPIRSTDRRQNTKAAKEADAETSDDSVDELVEPVQLTTDDKVDEETLATLKLNEFNDPSLYDGVSELKPAPLRTKEGKRSFDNYSQLNAAPKSHALPDLDEVDDIPVLIDIKSIPTISQDEPEPEEFEYGASLAPDDSPVITIERLEAVVAVLIEESRGKAFSLDELREKILSIELQVRGKKVKFDDACEEKIAQIAEMMEQTSGERAFSPPVMRLINLAVPPLFLYCLQDHTVFEDPRHGVREFWTTLACLAECIKSESEKGYKYLVATITAFLQENDNTEAHFFDCTDRLRSDLINSGYDLQGAESVLGSLNRSVEESIDFFLQMQRRLLFRELYFHRMIRRVWKGILKRVVTDHGLGSAQWHYTAGVYCSILWTTQVASSENGKEEVLRRLPKIANEMRALFEQYHVRKVVQHMLTEELNRLHIKIMRGMDGSSIVDSSRTKHRISPWFEEVIFDQSEEDVAPLTLEETDPPEENAAQANQEATFSTQGSLQKAYKIVNDLKKGTLVELSAVSTGARYYLSHVDNRVGVYTFKACKGTGEMSINKGQLVSELLRGNIRILGESIESFT